MYSKTHFPNQQPDEKVFLFLRRHWIAVVKIALVAIGLSIMPWIFYIVYSQTSDFVTSEIGYALFILFNSAYYLFVILFTFTNFIDYYLDVWIVSDRRVINIEQLGLFGREFSEKDLGRMQDITADIKGFVATLLNYGNIHIQTAGEEQRFVFKQVPHAEDVTRQISNLVAEYQKAHPGMVQATEVSQAQVAAVKPVTDVKTKEKPKK